MVQWFKRKKADTFVYNLELLRKQLDDLAIHAYAQRDSDGFQLTKKIIKIVININALSVNRIKDSNVGSFQKHLGRIQALEELDSLLDQLSEEGKHKARGEKAGHKRSILPKKGEYDVGAANF